MFTHWKLYFIFVFVHFAAAASNFCTQRPYTVLAQLSAYPPIRTYCSAKYPAPACPTASITATSRPPLVGAAPPSTTTLTYTSTVYAYSTTTVIIYQRYCLNIGGNNGLPGKKRAVATSTAVATPTTKAAVTTTNSAALQSLLASQLMLLESDIISSACFCIAGVRSCATPTARLMPRQRVSVTTVTFTSTIYTATDRKYSSINVCA